MPEKTRKTRNNEETDCNGPLGTRPLFTRGFDRALEKAGSPRGMNRKSTYVLGERGKGAEAPVAARAMKCLPTRSYLRTGRTSSDVMPTAMTITAETSRKNTVFLTCDHVAAGAERGSSSHREVIARAVPNLGRDRELAEFPMVFRLFALRTAKRARSGSSPLQ
jgi:hypothetical protein